MKGIRAFARDNSTDFQRWSGRAAREEDLRSEKLTPLYPRVGSLFVPAFGKETIRDRSQRSPRIQPEVRRVRPGRGI